MSRHVLLVERARVALALCISGAVCAGCLEVQQHSGWHDGAYDGKRDQRTEQTHFAGDRAAWKAALANRAQFQNEYQRTEREGQPR